MTNQLPSPEHGVQQSSSAAAAVNVPASTDSVHARGGHGIFGDPMVSWLLYHMIMIVLNTNVV